MTSLRSLGVIIMTLVSCGKNVFFLFFYFFVICCNCLFFVENISLSQNGAQDHLNHCRCQRLTPMHAGLAEARLAPRQTIPMDDGACSQITKKHQVECNRHEMTMYVAT